MAEKAFQELKEVLTLTPVLQLPNFSQTFVIECDACGVGIVLNQMNDPLLSIVYH